MNAGQRATKPLRPPANKPFTDNKYRSSLRSASRQRSLGPTSVPTSPLAALIAELKAKGQTMKFFNAGIAATVLARGDKLLVLDAEFDRLSNRLTLLRPR